MTNPVTTAREVSVVTIRVSNFSKRFPVRNNCGWQSKERPQNERQDYSLLTSLLQRILGAQEWILVW